MSNRIHALAQQLTGKGTLEECSVEEVRHIAKRFPYFAPAQFLLLQKLKQSGTQEEIDAQHRKAVLFYHDPLLFDYFISSDNFYEEAHDLSPVVEMNVLPNDVVEEPTVFEPVVGEPVVAADPVETTDIEEDNTQTEETATHVDTIEAAGEQEITAVENKKFDDNKSHAATQDSTTEFAPKVDEQEASFYEQENSIETATPEAPHDNRNIRKTDQPGNLMDTSAELSFEPFHTVDYFASQGIKITQDELPKDKLGKQLKSFTEWLKTMKRLPATQIAASAETFAEQKVESMANNSVSESDVVTEAMAEVWIKQGKDEKALDIYNKLSLLNPSKKAYFAAKIENLKLS